MTLSVKTLDSRLKDNGNDGQKILLLWTSYPHRNAKTHIIFHIIKGATQGKVLVSSTKQSDFSIGMTLREAAFKQIVKPDDPDMVIHITPDDEAISIDSWMKSLPCTITDLCIEVSTGPVVDFRLRDYLHMEVESNALPIIYAVHCEDGFVHWPIKSRKPNAISDVEETRKWLFPNGWYTLTRRFSSKEEKEAQKLMLH